MCHNSRWFWNRSEERMSRTTWGLMFSSSRQGGQSKLSICIILYSWYVSSKALREGGKIGKWMGSWTKVAILEWVQVQGIYSRHGGQKEESGPKRRDFDAHARTDERVHLEQDCRCWAEDMHGRPNTKFGLHRGDVGAPDVIRLKALDSQFKALGSWSVQTSNLCTINFHQNNHKKVTTPGNHVLKVLKPESCHDAML